MGRLEGKKVVISGTSSGMGKIAAQRFTQEGARVAGCGRDPGRSEEMRGMIGATLAAVAFWSPVRQSRF
jgi:meso-butanediol dehydrogenase / (S,S)-butanediol dehydrogenase / diacetyl reductase